MYRGATSPLLPVSAFLRHPGTAANANKAPDPFGHDGFGDAGLPVPDAGFQLEHAVQALIRLSKQYEGRS